MVVDLPSGIPPQASARLATKATRLEQDLARELGYDVPRRIRTSPLAGKASELRVGQERLGQGEIFNIVDDMYGEKSLEELASEDQKLRNRVKSQRNRLKKRFRGDRDNE